MMNSEQQTNSKVNILIVDDISDNLNLLAPLLQDYGYQVETVNNGSTALEIINNRIPDLILLDIMMPLMDGYEVCQAIKSQEKTQDIPVIFFSALDEVLDKVRAFKVGGNDYITKPFALEEVMARIENQLTIQKQKEFLKEQIREKQKAEQELYQSRELLNGVLKSSLDGVAVFHAVREDGKIVDFKCLIANPVAAMTVGKTTESLVGKLLLKELPEICSAELFTQFLEVVENCKVLETEYYYQQESVRAWLQIVAVKLSDGFAMTFRDITDKKQKVLALEQKNQELHIQANLDSLTKLANRGRFDEYIVQEWGKCAREKQPISLIICDVDYFKIYNDTYGHPAGDECLIAIAKAMSQIVKRPGDLVARYGGEEFAVILPNTNGRGGVQLAEEIRQKIKQLQITHILSKASDYVTLSLGVASIIPSAKLAYEDLINSADRALYEAKEQGRDRVVLNPVEKVLF